MILITGAAGKTGKAAITALAVRGARVRAVVRRPEYAAALMTLGAAEVAVARFDDRRALTQAAAGVQAIYHICPNFSPHEAAYARTVASAALSQGVDRFLYHSVLHPQIAAMPHHWQKMRAEEMLFTMGFDLTILQPTAYMQNILGAWRGVVEENVFRVPYPVETQLSLVDLDDVAETAARILTHDGHAGATYELVGTPPLTQNEVAAAIASALGRAVRAEAETVEMWDARAAAAGMDEHERATLAAMFRYYSAHGLIGNSNVLHGLLGRAPNSLADFLGRVAAKAAV